MSLLLGLALEPPRPGARDLRRKLHDQLRQAILEGRLAPGLRLPASRDLAGALGVSRNTVVAIYDLLLSEGYVVSRIGAGTFVAAIAERRAKSQPDQRLDARRLNPRWREPFLYPPRAAMAPYDLRLGAPDVSKFPWDLWRRLNMRALRALGRGMPAADPAGSLGLRQAIAAHVSYTRAVACGPDDVVVTSGAQQAFDLLARVLTRQDDLVAFEDPGYQRGRLAFTQAGARAAFVPVDQDGIAVGRIPKKAVAICVTPSHQFPLGVVMSAERRQALLAHAARTDALVIEDDYDSEFRFGGRPLDALKTLDREGRVFYVGTFSKSMFPDLRLGFIVAPSWARACLISARQVADGFGAPLEQDALAAFITEGHLARHVRAMHRIYDERRRVMLDALRTHCAESLEPLSSLAGLHLAARLKHRKDTASIARRAAERGLAIDWIARQAPGSPPADVLALGFGRIATSAVADAIRILSTVL